MANSAFQERVSDWTSEVLVIDHRAHAREAQVASAEALHGTPGDPAMHPKGGTKGKRKAGGGGWVGSDHYSEDEQIPSLTDYIDDSDGINGWLRHGQVGGQSEMDDEEADQAARAMMDLVEIQEPARFGTVLYRGMREDIFKDLKAGSEFHDRGFTSTTSDPKIAQEFAGDNGILVRVKIPKGTKVLNVDKVDATDLERIEKENILQAGTRYRILKTPADKGSGPVDYVLEVIQ
jgi:hypothetical protein